MRDSAADLVISGCAETFAQRLAALRQAREIAVSLKATLRLARIDAVIAAATLHQDPNDRRHAN